MIDQGQEAGLRPGDPAPGVATTPDTSDDPQDECVERSPRPRATLNPQVRDRIASQLRALYDTVVQQPVPDRFADLIAKLETGERKDP